MLKKFRLAMFLLIAVALSACGGGGGSSPVEDDPNGEQPAENTDNNGQDTDTSQDPEPGSTLKPSTSVPSQNDQGQGSSGSGSDLESRFINRLVSETDYNFWACFATDPDALIVMILGKDGSG